MRRMPPNKVTQNLAGLLRLVPDITDELLQRVDQPLDEAKDPETVRDRRASNGSLSNSLPICFVVWC